MIPRDDPGDEIARIRSPDQAAAARAELRTLELHFRNRADPEAKRHLAREIMRLRTALTGYRVRAEVRQVRHEGDRSLE